MLVAVWYTTGVKRAKDQGFRQPAEWAHHDAVWTAWPHIAEEWAEGLDGPRQSLAGMIEAIVGPSRRIPSREETAMGAR